MAGKKKYIYKIVATSYTNSVDTIAPNVDSLELMPVLKNIKSFLDKNYATVDIIQTEKNSTKDIAERSEAKFTYKVGQNSDWVNKAGRVFKLGQQDVRQYSHSYVVYYAIYNTEQNTPVFQHEFPQSAVINSTKMFQDFVFEKLFDKQYKLRVAVLKVIDIATNKQEEADTHRSPIYSRVMYSSDCELAPVLIGTGVHIRKCSDKQFRCTPLTFNKKVRTVMGGDKQYFVNQGDAVNVIQDIVNVIKKYGKRSLKQNERQ